MSWLILAYCVNKLVLRFLQMQIAVLRAFQAIGCLKQPLGRRTGPTRQEFVTACITMEFNFLEGC